MPLRLGRGPLRLGRGPQGCDQPFHVVCRGDGRRHEFGKEIPIDGHALGQNLASDLPQLSGCIDGLEGANGYDPSVSRPIGSQRKRSCLRSKVGERANPDHPAEEGENLLAIGVDLQKLPDRIHEVGGGEALDRRVIGKRPGRAGCSQALAACAQNPFAGGRFVNHPKTIQSRDSIGNPARQQNPTQCDSLIRGRALRQWRWRCGLAERCFVPHHSGPRSGIR